MEPLPANFPSMPDLLEPVHAFRDWRISPDGLTSPRTGVVWSTRTLVAECRPTTAEDFIRPVHRAPGRGCSCGIHGYLRPGSETSKVDYRGVTGIITVWGDVEIHDDGVRAEFARIEALGVYSRWTRRQAQAVHDVADELGVDLVDLHDLRDAASRYGSPVPTGLVPAPAGSRRAKRSPAAARVLVFGR